MADETVELEEKEDGGSKKKLIIIIAAVVVVLILGGVAAWLLLSDDDGTDVAAKGNAPTLGTVAAQAVYVSIPGPFLFNLTEGSRTYLVQIKVQLQVRSGSAQDVVRKHTPLIRDALLTTFSTAQPSALQTREGKEELRTTALLNVQTAMQSITGKPQVERVLFTGFVMQ